jgi:hypothetical protein
VQRQLYDAILSALARFIAPTSSDLATYSPLIVIESLVHDVHCAKSLAEFWSQTFARTGELAYPSDNVKSILAAVAREFSTTLPGEVGPSIPSDSFVRRLHETLQQLTPVFDELEREACSSPSTSEDEPAGQDASYDWTARARRFQLLEEIADDHGWCSYHFILALY